MAPKMKDSTRLSHKVKGRFRKILKWMDQFNSGFRTGFKLTVLKQWKVNVTDASNNH
jgi:hypothetical protein